MDVVAWIVGILLAAAFVMAGLAKLRGMAPMDEARERLGVSPGLWRAIGGLEILGAIGVIVGLVDDGSFGWIGVLAAVGLILVTIGAVIYHARAGDPPKEMAGAVMLMMLSILYIVMLAIR